MKKTLMILAMGMFLGTIGYTSVAAASNIVQTEQDGEGDKKKCKKKDCKGDECKSSDCKSADKKASAEKKGTAKKSCASESGKRSCCSSKAKTADKK